VPPDRFQRQPGRGRRRPHRACLHSRRAAPDHVAGRRPEGRHAGRRRARGECLGGVRIRGGHRGPRDRRDGVVAV